MLAGGCVQAAGRSLTALPHHEGQRRQPIGNQVPDFAQRTSRAVCARLRGARSTARGGETSMSGMKRRELITLLGGAVVA